MVNCELGKIYAIVAPNLFKCYIGSTCQTLHNRLNQHRYITSTCNSSELLSDPDVKLILIENYPCGSRKELFKREGEIIKAMGTLCVNKQIAGRTKKERNTIDNENRDKTIRSCICGGSYTYQNKSRHMNSKSHLKSIF